MNARNAATNRVMTLKELAKYLNVHPVTIGRLIRRDGPPFFRLGVDYPVNRENIDKWLAENERSRRQADYNRLKLIQTASHRGWILIGEQDKQFKTTRPINHQYTG